MLLIAFHNTVRKPFVFIIDETANRIGFPLARDLECHAALLGIDRPKVSSIFNGRLDGFLQTD